MISTETFTETAEFEEYKATLPKEPEGDGKKEYIVGCRDASDWQFIHEVLIRDGTLEDNIPNDSCESADDCPHSATRGVYLLNSSEVQELVQHSKVLYVHINYKKYPGTYASTGNDDIDSHPTDKTARYSSTIESQRELWYSSVGPIVTFSITTAGTGYTAQNNVTVDSGTTNATFNILNVDSGGGITSLEIANAGTGYTVGDVLDVDGGNDDATITVTSIDYNSILDEPPTSANLYRDGFHLTRHMQKDDPWYGSANTTVINSTIQQYGTGSDVDVIVADSDSWFGHVEFQNNLNLNPTNYTGGNVLPGNGTCDALDLVLESPYYIDPDFFNANSSSRLTSRWDGTTVPVESVAIDWWRNVDKRSAKFCPVGTTTVDGDAGTATGNNNFGTLLGIDSTYTRARNNGTYNSRNYSGSHGTPCMSQTYGRTLGWAYNANKWFVAIMGYYSIDYETYFDLLKIFHQIKPINSTYGTQDPTISSNSWGKSHSVGTATDWEGGYYYFHAGTTGSGSVNYSTYSNRPEFIKYQGLQPEYLESHATVTAANEMANSGVIFVASAGNSYMKQVKSNHDDFDNYIDSGSSTALTNATTTNSSTNSVPSATWYNTTNRRGFPQQSGVNRSTTPYTYPVISVGCLDHDYESNGKERKVNYSNMGNAVDVFTAGDDSLGASYNTSTNWAERYDAYYDLSGNTSNSSISGGSIESQDKAFNGTSSACPIFAGLLATKVQYNRSWNYNDVRTWIQSLGQVDSSEFHYGSEATTAEGSEWSDTRSLHGAPGYVAYDKTAATTFYGSYGRQLSPQTGNATTPITDGTISASSPYAGQSDADAQIYDYLWDNYSYFDFDGDGIVSPTDGAIFIRILIGPAFDGKLLSGMSAGDVLPISSNATRTGANDEETEALIRAFFNNNFTVQIDRGTYNGSSLGNRLVYNIDADPNDYVQFNGEGVMMARVFGAWQNGAPIETTEFLDPHDGGPAVWNGSTWDYGIVTTITGPLNITGLLNINI